MNISEDIHSIRQQVNGWRSRGEAIAFVPTMGNLHNGHLQLVEHAKNKANRVVVSIFVNPLQFNEASDFEKYPRTLEQDLEALNKQSVDAVFIPSEDELYPMGKDRMTKVSVPGLGDILEGECRPGHFIGVTTVVAKLFNIVQPDIACFGEKDFQQLLLIRHMVEDLNMPVVIDAVATCREPDGLAMSSRNSRLDSAQRAIAPEIHRVLSSVVTEIQQGNKDFSRLETDAVTRLDASGFSTEYVAIRAADNLARADENDIRLVILAAARLGEVRLIDNIPLNL